jgi:hypothetical protein
MSPKLRVYRRIVKWTADLGQRLHGKNCGPQHSSAALCCVTALKFEGIDRVSSPVALIFERQAASNSPTWTDAAPNIGLITVDALPVHSTNVGSSVRSPSALAKALRASAAASEFTHGTLAAWLHIGQEAPRMPIRC